MFIDLRGKGEGKRIRQRENINMRENIEMLPPIFTPTEDQTHNLFD